MILLIPVLIGLTFNLAPRSQALEDEIVSVQNAQRSQNPAGEAMHMGKVLAWEPWRLNLWAEAGINANEARDYAIAVRYFQTALHLGVLSDVGLISLGEAYLQSGDWLGAVTTWQELVDAGRADEGLYEKIFAVQMDHQAYAGAVHTAEEWIGQFPQNAQAAFKVGLLECVLDPQNAEAALQKAASLDAGLAPQINTLSKAIATALKESHAGYQRVVIGRALGSLGIWDLARQSFEKATEATPDYAEGWAFLGESLEQLNQDGSQQLKHAEALDPNSIIVNGLIALWYRRNGHPETSLEQLKKIAAKEPDQAVWQIELGNTASMMGDLYGALKYYQKATVLDPSDLQVWLTLGGFSVVHQFQTREVGLPAARQALILAPDSATALDLMGRVMQALQDMKSAERFLQQAIEKDASYAAAHLHLAQLYLQQNLFDQAYPFLMQASKNAGNDTETGLLAKRLLNQYFGGQ